MKKWFSRLSLWSAALLVVFTLLLFPVQSPGLNAESTQPSTSNDLANFVGSEACRECHPAAYDKWKGSHHDLAMDVASETTVLGDFSDVIFSDPYTRKLSRFYRKEGKFFVTTEGPDGRPGDFEITYVFGVTPLQQYLVPFPDGRLQCLNIAWDVRKKVWYRLPPYEVKGPGDWLHWTRGGQTWNTMCAECHSTRVTKGYDPDSGRYQTTWAEIDVGCEACHGPGAKHLAWSRQPAESREPAENYALEIQSVAGDNRAQVEQCAPCHSRRFQLDDNKHLAGKLLDLMVPQLLSEGVYFADGQILEEDYVYGSFTQSKMYAHGVGCSDCHDLHSLATREKANSLCTRCHSAATYDSEKHHFHKLTINNAPSAGSLCVKCHMPGRNYMGIDYRPDHSLRIPRPDLSLTLGTPNACSAQGCHAAKPVEWAAAQFKKWYGAKAKPHYGEVLSAGRAGSPEAEKGLIRLAGDKGQPVIVRATALELLRGYPTDASRGALIQELTAEEALIRYTAVRSLASTGSRDRVALLGARLFDPIKAVRMEAAMQLTALPQDSLSPRERSAFEAGLREYREAMHYNADLAPQRYNLGNLAANLGDTNQAVSEYRKALSIDEQFYPAKVNLAMLYNQQGKNPEAEKLLRDVVTTHPELYETSYSLGLLLAEMEKYSAAEIALQQAAAGMPNYARAQYNLGQVRLVLNKRIEAEKAFRNALSIEPRNQDAFMALARTYLETGQTDRAEALAVKTLGTFSDHKAALELLRYLRK